MQRTSKAKVLIKNNNLLFIKEVNFSETEKKQNVTNVEEEDTLKENVETREKGKEMIQDQFQNQDPVQDP